MLESSSNKRQRQENADASFTEIGLQLKIGQSSILYSHDFQERDVRLIEVSEDIIKCVSDGEILKIIGLVEASGKGGIADTVLTTDQKTFSIKKVETSNAVYVVYPSNTDNYTVKAASQDYYELKLIPARTEKISDILHSSQYTGVDDESGKLHDESSFLSYNDLRIQIQASDAEFSSALSSLGVVELGGKMRLISKAAKSETTQQLIYTIIEQGWDISSINEAICRSLISDTDPVLLNYCLKSLGHKISPESRDTGLLQEISDIWTLDRDTISKATAHNLFKSQKELSKPWECEDFLRTWDAETPGVNAPDERLLLGIAIKIETKLHKSCSVDGSTSLHSYQYLPFEQLSTDLQKRLEQLFAARSMYTELELQPYFLDMIGMKGKPASVAALLLPHTRLIDDFYMSK